MPAAALVVSDRKAPILTRGSTRLDDVGLLLIVELRCIQTLRSDYQTATLALPLVILIFVCKRYTKLGLTHVRWRWMESLVEHMHVVCVAGQVNCLVAARVSAILLRKRTVSLMVCG